MKLAFCLFNYFPYGGLQRDFLRIARLSYARGHEIHVYTMRWDAEEEEGLHLHVVPVVGLQNHTRAISFTKRVKKELSRHHYDTVIGFNKMPFLDIYYAADVCYQARIVATRSYFYRLLSPRYRAWKKLEQAVFKARLPTEILLISSQQQAEYTRYYDTESTRFHLLPPGISKDRIAPPNAAEIRALVRDEYGIKDDDLLLLMVGSGFKTKGLDRAINGLAALPTAIKEKTRLWVIGQDDSTPFRDLAERLQVTERVVFFGGRNDIPSLMLAGDVLVHPAYHENTGTVLLEAIVAGLPVLTVDVCGYAHYVNDANAGMVLKTPFEQNDFNAALQSMLTTNRDSWRANGIAFANQADLYSMPDKAVDLIEKIGQESHVLS